MLSGLLSTSSMNEPLFSERYGYVKPSNVLVREKITPEIQNAICNCFEALWKIGGPNHDDHLIYLVGMCHREVQRRLWVSFLNRYIDEFWGPNNTYPNVIVDVLRNDETLWYEKLDLVEATIKLLVEIIEEQPNGQTDCPLITKPFIDLLNSEFERLNFAYRIVKGKIVDIASEEEIAEIEKAIEDSPENIRMHLTNALDLLAIRPEGNYRNSIKESISAVEAYCRDKTGETTLGKALKRLESTSIVIHDLLKRSFELLYAYTNAEDTGIRHANLDKTGKYVPSEAEAQFMLVSCSAFINYLRKKEPLIELPP